MTVNKVGKPTWLSEPLIYLRLITALLEILEHLRRVDWLMDLSEGDQQFFFNELRHAHGDIAATQAVLQRWLAHTNPLAPLFSSQGVS